MEAARHWVAGGNQAETEDSDGWKAELREMGVPEAEIAAAFAARESASGTRATRDFLVHPANEAALVAFFALTTQWHVAPQSGRITGLRYREARHQVEATCKRLGRADPDAVFADLQVMELAAIAAVRNRDAANE